MNHEDAALLKDVEQAFGPAPRIFSRELVEALNSGRWKGQANEMWLANRLRPYGVKPKTLWIGEKAAKGYTAAAFKQAVKDARLREDSIGTQRRPTFAPLMADDVARRAIDLAGPDRELVFALQYFSWQPGGLAGLISEILDSGKISTPKMRQFGMGEDQVYASAQVKAVRAEFPDGQKQFPLTGEIDETAAIFLPRVPDEEDWQGSREQALARHREFERCAALQPDAYPARDFVLKCREVAQETLPALLKNICVKRIDLDQASPWWYGELLEHLRAYVSRQRSESPQIVETEISRRIGDGLSYCYETGEMVPIEGGAGIGKTYCAKAWCLQNPGKARYVEVPATTDEASFILRFAEAYGLGCDSTTPINQVRERVELAAKTSRLMLVIDSAHWLLPESGNLRKRPWRVAWLMSLVSQGVPVALLLSSGFKQAAARNQSQTNWNWEQFDTRIGVPIKLPKELPTDEIKAVARAILPGGDAKCIQALVGYAMFTGELAGMGHIVRRAEFEAEKAGREVTLADISSAIQMRMPLNAQAVPQAKSGKGKPRNTSPIVAAVKPGAEFASRRDEPLDEVGLETPRIKLEPC